MDIFLKTFNYTYFQNTVERPDNLIANWKDVLPDRTAQARDDADCRKTTLRIFTVVKSCEEERLKLIHVLGEVGSYGYRRRK